MNLDNKIPREMIGDIVLTFLFGIRTDHMTCDGIVKTPDIVASLEVPFYATWKDILSLRKPLINNMKGTDKKELRKLAKALKKVWKL